MLLDVAIAGLRRKPSAFSKISPTRFTIGAWRGCKRTSSRRRSATGPKHLNDFPNTRERSTIAAWRYQELGELDKALADFNLVIELSPKDATAYLTIEEAFFFTGKNLPKVLTDFSKAIELDADYAQAHRNLRHNVSTPRGI